MITKSLEKFHVDKMFLLYAVSHASFTCQASVKLTKNGLRMLQVGQNARRVISLLANTVSEGESRYC